MVISIIYPYYIYIRTVYVHVCTDMYCVSELPVYGSVWCMNGFLCSFSFLCVRVVCWRLLCVRACCVFVVLGAHVYCVLMITVCFCLMITLDVWLWLLLTLAVCSCLVLTITVCLWTVRACFVLVTGARACLVGARGWGMLVFDYRAYHVITHSLWYFTLPFPHEELFHPNAPMEVVDPSAGGSQNPGIPIAGGSVQFNCGMRYM